MPRAATLCDGEVHVVQLPAYGLGPSDVRVDVTRAGVNFWEVMQKRGRVPLTEPRILGSEGVGIVSEVGAEVTSLTVGTRVAWAKVRGSYAEEVTGDASLFHAVPASVGDETAAGLLFQGLTAHYLTTSAWPLSEGSCAVVTAAAGGVGLLLTRLLVGRGVTVLGVVSSPSKEPAVLGAGAVAALGYGPDLVDRIRPLTAGGVSAVYDSVGGQGALDLLGVLEPRGAMVLYGAACGAEAPITPAHLVAGSFYLTRTTSAHYLADRASATQRSEQLLAAAAAGALDVVPGGSWSLDEAGQALEAMESRSTVGKLYVVP